MDYSRRLKSHIAQLGESGLRARLLQAFFVQAMCSLLTEPASTTKGHVDALRALFQEIPHLDKWLWNLPIAFVSHTKRLDKAFKRVQKHVNIPWPTPLFK